MYVVYFISAPTEAFYKVSAGHGVREREKEVNHGEYDILDVNPP